MYRTALHESRPGLTILFLRSRPLPAPRRIRSGSKRAIRERQAILGMTFREVETAKGAPLLKQRGDTLPEIHRSKGGVEQWVYDLTGGNEASVVFGVNGLVIQSSDVGDKPRLGQAIRQ